jgi:molecular chaperone DnaJ
VSDSKEPDTQEMQIMEKLRDAENFRPNPSKDKGFFDRMKDIFQ